MRLRRRLHRKKLGRPGHAAPPPPKEEVLRGIPIESEDDEALAGKSTLVEAQAVSDPLLQSPPKPPGKTASQDETAEQPVILPKKRDANAETEGALDAQLKEPDPPEKLTFSCGCGAKLVATRKAYDKRMRCGICNALMLVSLVWDPDRRAHEIVPFRVESLPDV